VLGHVPEHVDGEKESLFFEGTEGELTFDQTARPVFVRVCISQLCSDFPMARRFPIGQEAQRREYPSIDREISSMYNRCVAAQSSFLENLPPVNSSKSTGCFSALIMQKL